MPQPRTMTQIADALGIRQEWLSAGVGEMEPDATHRPREPAPDYGRPRAPEPQDELAAALDLLDGPVLLTMYERLLTKARDQPGWLLQHMPLLERIGCRIREGEEAALRCADKKSGS